MKKILIVFGTRPEAIKMAPVVLAFKSNKKMKTVLCVTGQHKEMLDQVLNVFSIKPDIDLSLMTNNQTLAGLTSLLIKEIDYVLIKEKPDLVLIHGDTSTTFATAIACFYAQIPIGHVEAGLRTGDLTAPWPEEMNRCYVGKIAKLHFCPTSKSKHNLLKEGISKEGIYITGNTVIDSLLFALEKINTNKELLEQLKEKVPCIIENKNIICVTGHRRENFGNGFKNICESLIEISKIPNVQVIYPVHLNPNVRKTVMDKLDGVLNIHLIEPLEYLPFVYLMHKSKIILTDSGGIQEEAPTLKKPVLVMREITERPEALEAGTIKLVGTDSKKIVQEVQKLLNNEQYYNSMIGNTNPYGDGKSSSRIVEIVESYLN